MKKCKVCGKDKSHSLFYKSGKYKGKQTYRRHCKNCARKDWSSRLMTRIASRVNTNRRFKCKNKENEVTKKYLEELFLMQGGKCFWLGVDLDTNRDSLSKVSVDRINNTMPYQKDNIVLSSVFANVGRSNYTVIEFIELLDKIK